MKRYLIIALLFAGCGKLSGQELYVFTEPASNMPAHSVSPRISAKYLRMYNNIRQRYNPALMFGISKHLMVHVSGTISNIYTSELRAESVKLYGQWRFYSNDAIHHHFRMAAFAEGAYTKSPYLYDELNLDGDNNGMQGGLIATQLLNKLALSSTASVIRTFDKKVSLHNGLRAGTALSYTLSAGYLLFPRNYSSYRQTNLNVYTELIGMQGLNHKGYMLDLAPALQLIVNSNTKLNLGYRFQLNGNMLRTGRQSWLITVERTFLGALPRRKR